MSTEATSYKQLNFLTTWPASSGNLIQQKFSKKSGTKDTFVLEGLGFLCVYFFDIVIAWILVADDVKISAEGPISNIKYQILLQNSI